MPNLRAYDPAFAYEIAEIVRHGLREMFEQQKSVFYYLTVGNESYAQASMPEGSQEGIIRGMYRFRSAGLAKPKAHARLLGSGSILREAIAAQELLESYGVAADVYSVTSYKELYRDAIAIERRTLLHPDQPGESPYVASCLASGKGPVVAASDYVRALPDSIARWVPGPFVSLGTDGFGRSEDRASLRDFFEVDRRHIAYAAISALVRQGDLPKGVAERARKDLAIDVRRPSSLES